MRLAQTLWTLLAIGCLGPAAYAAGRASHVVLIVWDGMRPDFVSEATTPTLFARARDGVTFLHHHPVFISTTEVNAVALATGVYPWQSGLVGNHEFRPALDPAQAVSTDSLPVARRGDALSGNHYLAFPTVAEILHEHGLRTAVAGSKPVALLHDRAPRMAGALGVSVFAGDVLPAAMEEGLVKELGKFPDAGPDKIRLDEWTTQALIGPLWREQVPTLSVLWLAEPDYSQHETGPGSAASLAAFRGSDRDLGRVLAALQKRNLQDATDVIVVSDHGFSTILENIDVAATLKAHGFHAVRKLGGQGQKDGDIVVVGNGGAVFCYVAGHDPALTEQTVHCLQAEPYSGVIFSRVAVDGAFPMSDSGLQSPAGPDIVVAMRWTPEGGKDGAPGGIYCDWKSFGPGQGMHGSLSAYDMHNTCIAFGPDFAKGMKDSLPTGNIDIAPTILWILGIAPKERMSGRVLSEAMTMAGPEIHAGAPRHRQAEWRGSGFLWRQYLDTSEVNGVTYLDQGNGRQASP
jgi:predicted AlkP superfamily pyrophosphatase or phosphodiesterase